MLHSLYYKKNTYVTVTSVTVSYCEEHGDEGARRRGVEFKHIGFNHFQRIRKTHVARVDINSSGQGRTEQARTQIRVDKEGQTGEEDN